MELVVLGSGSAFPGSGDSVRNPAGYAVRLGRRIVLFDLGFGDVRQLARAGLDASEVTDVFLTHRHPDHMGDLPALLFLLRYHAKLRAGRLRVWGPRGLAGAVRGLSRVYSPWLSPKGYRLEVRELGHGATAARDGWRLAVRRARHNAPALSYRFLYKGKTLVYSGDTGFDEGLAGFARGCDLFLIECTLGPRETYAWHLNARQALEIVRRSRCKRALLTHISWSSDRSLKGGRFGRVRKARDLTVTKI